VDPTLVAKNATRMGHPRLGRCRLGQVGTSFDFAQDRLWPYTGQNGGLKCLHYTDRKCIYPSLGVIREANDSAASG